MSSMGQIALGENIGRTKSRKYIWVKCSDCGLERWIGLRAKNSSLCLKCTLIRRNKAEVKSGASHGRWKGGTTMHSSGYIEEWVSPSDFYHSMATKGRNYVPQHRLVMARHLKRCLLEWEIVHHKNGIKTDNRLENLQLLPSMPYHLPDTLSKSLIMRLRGEVKFLESENERLRRQLSLRLSECSKILVPGSNN